MMILNWVIPMFIYFIGLVVFSYKSKHLLLMLLSLEFIVVSLYYELYLTFYLYEYEHFFSMVFLTMSVCEGALGLSILVTMIRCYGNDYFNSFNILMSFIFF